jgi:hypothetical protein
MTRLGWLFALVVLGAMAAGCGQTEYTSPDRYTRGLVVVLSGAGGMMGECDRIREGLNTGGVDRALENFDWSSGGVLSDQTNVEANRRLAAQLAQRVEGYLAEYPGRPVHLVAISAGTGLVVWALEDLGPQSQVEGAVLMASSLDARYNLASALSKIKTHLYSFNSMADTVLSLGVTWAGTVDRNGGIAGGLVGFSPPEAAAETDKALYKDKLVQISWWPGDMVLGNLGDHLGTTNPAFVRARIAPLILGQEPPKTGDAGAAVAAGSPPHRGAAARAAPEAAASGSAPKDGGQRRFFGWNVGRSAGPPGPVSASPSPGREAAIRPPEQIDESQFFTEMRRLP